MKTQINQLAAKGAVFAPSFLTLLAVSVLTVTPSAQGQSFAKAGERVPRLITAATYVFTTPADVPLEDMSSGTTLLVGAASDDGNSGIANMGFDFWYDDVRFTQFGANVNGFIRLGAVVIGDSSDNSTGFNSTTNAPKIAPFYDDLCTGTNGKVHFKTIGMAPNRKLIIEWQNMQITKDAGCAGVGGGTFQLWLFESVHVTMPGAIQFVYGSGMVATQPADGGYSVGLQSGAATNFASVTTATDTVSYAAANNTQTTAVPAVKTFLFTPTPKVQAVNLSTRVQVQTGDNVGIGGLIITGSDPKPVLIRGIGPSLTDFSVPDVLADPVLELHGPGGPAIMTNNNWRDAQEAEIQATGIPPTNNLESAIVVTLAPGAYTAIVRGNGNTSGVGLVEFYDLNQSVNSRLANLSTRAFVSTGDNIVIAGFVLSYHNGSARIVLRGIGPSLAPGSFPPGAVLADPTLELRDSNAALLAANNDWLDNAAQAAEIISLGMAPTNNLEPALVVTFPPGIYTALLAGRNNTTGIALVEVYDFDQINHIPIVISFDGVIAPALPAGWVPTNASGDPTMWVTSTVNPDTAPNAVFIPDQGGISDKFLDSPSFEIGSASAAVSFQNNFNTQHDPPPNEVFWDGGVLEVSSPNINGGAFTDITTPEVGGSFVTGGYTGTIDATTQNPLAGRMAWSGNSGGYINTVVNLGPSVNGQTIKLRFRIGTDQSGGQLPGWRIDTISIAGASSPSPTPASMGMP